MSGVRFAYRRGTGVKQRVMHIVAYNRLGEPDGVLCGSPYPFNTTCNLPLGLPICRRCRKEADKP